jgi:hypothetical protein
VIFRATPQWFISMEQAGLRAAALAEIGKVEWTPGWGEQRIYSMIAGRPDWCISRQRMWGVPLSLFTHRETGELHPRTPELVDQVAGLVAKDGIDAWLLILDTRGINVWCAAGKGTFGTFELCRQIAETGLADRVSQRTLILPQLGAVGVAAHQVAKVSGFRVVYGPVRAADIPAWLAAGKKKDESMRLVSFGFRDRLVLAPVELSGDATQVVLNIDGHPINYAASQPARVAEVQWTGSGGQARLEFLPQVAGSPSQLSETGPWAWFRMRMA